MRLHISHHTVYRYDRPAKGAIQTLRLTPRNHDAQFVLDWRIEVSRDMVLHSQPDAYGNLTHVFTVDGPLDELRVDVTGTVDTTDTGGLVSGTLERFPASFYLRESDLTGATQEMREVARQTYREARGDDLAYCHALMLHLNQTVAFCTESTVSQTNAAEAFRLKRGVCQDYAHLFIALARAAGVPARYVSGYFHRSDGENDQVAGHAWAEAYIPALGWVGFDPANAICVSEAHVRVATGLDYLAAAPVRGAHQGGGGETLDVRVVIGQSQLQMQN